MATSIVRSRARVALLGLVSALLAATTFATPSVAASTTTFHAVYPDELTTPRTCPPGTPAGAFCYTGVGHGPTTPPGSTGTEQFAGFVDQNRADPVTHCAPDFNVVSITTNSGTLFLTTNGNACPTSQTTSVDNGTWRAFGGTGIFEDASGSGTVATVGTFNANGTISSSSTYDGTLTLH
jgi:hypothetical protein